MLKKASGGSIESPQQSPTKTPSKPRMRKTPKKVKTEEGQAERELTPTPARLIEPKSERKATAGSKRKLKEMIDRQRSDGDGSETEVDEFNGDAIVSQAPGTSFISGLLPDLKLESGVIKGEYEGTGGEEESV